MTIDLSYFHGFSVPSEGGGDGSVDKVVAVQGQGMQSESSASTCILSGHSRRPAIPALDRQRQGFLRAAWLAGLTESVNFRLSKRPCLNIDGREKTELRKTPAVNLWSAHSHS